MNRRHSYSAADYIDDQCHQEDEDSRQERLRERRLADDMERKPSTAQPVRRYTATTAEKISARFHDDGSLWVDDNGNNLEEVLDSLAACTYDNGNAVYRFADGSTIVLYAGHWDIK
tara:strand:+ start:73 stop:420 length:348 start_codon:yes stop_codon:yes gene_type:complete